MDRADMFEEVESGNEVRVGNGVLLPPASLQDPEQSKLKVEIVKQIVNKTRDRLENRLQGQCPKI